MGHWIRWLCGINSGNEACKNYLMLPALILMGAWCGAHTAETTRKKTKMRLRPQAGSEVYQMGRNGKKS
jgi:hypothetical protein